MNVAQENKHKINTYQKGKKNNKKGIKKKVFFVKITKLPVIFFLEKTIELVDTMPKKNIPKSFNEHKETKQKL